MNIARHLELTIMHADKNFKSHRLLRIFGRSNSIFEDPCEAHEQLVMSQYSLSARNYM